MAAPQSHPLPLHSSTPPPSVLDLVDEDGTELSVSSRSDTKTPSVNEEHGSLPHTPQLTIHRLSAGGKMTVSVSDELIHEISPSIMTTVIASANASASSSSVSSSSSTTTSTSSVTPSTASSSSCLWTAHVDSSSRQTMYLHSITKQTTFDKPPEFESTSIPTVITTTSTTASASISSHNHSSVLDGSDPDFSIGTIESRHTRARATYQPPQLSSLPSSGSAQSSAPSSGPTTPRGTSTTASAFSSSLPPQSSSPRAAGAASKFGTRIRVRAATKSVLPSTNAVVASSDSAVSRGSSNTPSKENHTRMESTSFLELNIRDDTETSPPPPSRSLPANSSSLQPNSNSDASSSSASSSSFSSATLQPVSPPSASLQVASSSLSHSSSSSLISAPMVSSSSSSVNHSADPASRIAYNYSGTGSGTAAPSAAASAATSRRPSADFSELVIHEDGGAAMAALAVDTAAARNPSNADAPCHTRGGKSDSVEEPSFSTAPASPGAAAVHNPAFHSSSSSLPSIDTVVSPKIHSVSSPTPSTPAASSVLSLPSLSGTPKVVTLTEEMWALKQPMTRPYAHSYAGPRRGSTGSVESGASLSRSKLLHEGEEWGGGGGGGGGGRARGSSVTHASMSSSPKSADQVVLDFSPHVFASSASNLRFKTLSNLNANMPAGGKVGGEVEHPVTFPSHSRTFSLLVSSSALSSVSSCPSFQQPALPASVFNDAHRFSLHSYATAHFRTFKKKTGLMSSRRMSVLEILSWQREPIGKSLLLNSKKYNELAVRCFKLIMMAMGDWEMNSREIRDKEKAERAEKKNASWNEKTTVAAALAAQSSSTTTTGSSEGSSGDSSYESRQFASVHTASSSASSSLQNTATNTTIHPSFTTPLNPSSGHEWRDLVQIGMEKPALRDEIFLQLCKQTRSNPHTSSLLLGWKLLCVCCAYFVPSAVFADYLLTYCTSHYRDPHPHITTMAQWCHWRIHRSMKAGVVTDFTSFVFPQSIDQLLTFGVRSSSVLFGGTIEYIMLLQRREGSIHTVPEILIILIDAIKSFGGFHAKGIFRVAAKQKEVKQLMWAFEKGEYEYIHQVKHDVHVIADVLKHWCRDLSEPIIPNDLHSECRYE